MTRSFPRLLRFTETDYLATFSDNPSDIYGASSIDKAMKNAYTQTRKFVMAEYGLTEAEATTIITTGVDFSITQLVDGNWGVHAVIPKSIFYEKLFLDTTPAEAMLDTPVSVPTDPVLPSADVVPAASAAFFATGSLTALFVASIIFVVM
jgi:hypothetical protein